MDHYELIRTAHRVYGKNISEIVRETGHARNTVKKALRGEFSGYTARQSQSSPALGPYLAIIDDWLQQDTMQPKKQRHTAHRIYERLVEEHDYSGSEPTVRRYVREAKARLGVNGAAAFIPLEPDVGREAEVDWGTAVAIISGERQQIKLFCLRSKFSGKHFVRCYPCERQQAFFDAHLHAFEFFGGIFPILIYDNLTSAVRKVLRGRHREEQDSFVTFRAYHNFEARFCNPGQGHEKGGVEGLVGYARRNYLVPVPEATSLDALNQDVLAKCVAYGSHQIQGRSASVEALFEQERSHLLRLPDVRFRTGRTLSGKVDKYATVVVDHNRYSVPTAYVGFRVEALIEIERIRLVSRHKEIASHERVYGKQKWVLSAWHYLDLLRQRPQAFDSARPIKAWREQWPPSLEALLAHFCQRQGHSCGVKEFLGVLLLYKDYPAAEVDAAVDLAVASQLSCGDGVKHLVQHAAGEPVVESLPQWDSLPPVDVSVYGQLQADTAPTTDSGGGQ
jgi:transposase